jgi:carbon storage regulator
MLVLSRQVDESIVINDNIVITVLAVEGDRVKIGIKAPREIVVLREELWKAIKEQEQIAKDLAASAENESFAELRKFLSEEAGEDPDKTGDQA